MRSDPRRLRRDGPAAHQPGPRRLQPGLSDLYLDHHLRPLQDFAESLGLGLRVQAYGLEIDTTYDAAVLDIAETESLGFNNLDDFRIMAGGRDIGGRTILSCEAICYAGAAYNTTWGANSTSPTAPNQALFTLNSIFAAGVNQAMIHGFAYDVAPGVTWPGFAAFSPYYNGAIGFGEAWGPRTPQWSTSRHRLATSRAPSWCCRPVRRSTTSCSSARRVGLRVASGRSG